MSTKYPFMVEFTGTPEAGKTTCIKTIQERFEKKENITVAYVQESAEIVSCSNIPKGSFEAHLAMRLLSLYKIINAKYEKCDIVLIDRGVLDGIFYTEKFLTDSQENIYECENLIHLLDCLKSITPNLLIMFKVSPEEAVRRKGHEGRLVNVPNLTHFNKLLDSFEEYISSQNHFCIDTTFLAEEEIANTVYNTIISELKKAGRI